MTSPTMTNEERSRVEVELFRTEHFGRYFAYHAPARLSQVKTREMGDRITTWMGDDLARVIERGKVWTSNMGDRRQSFRARAINGDTYSGTAFLSAGDYVRMRRMDA